MASLSRSLAVTLAALVLAAALPAAAQAHASLLAAQPAPGQRLQRSPSRVVLRFSKPLDRRLTSVHLIAAGSGRSLVVRSRFTGPTTVELMPDAVLARAVYRVAWHSVSTDEGHPLDGSFEFGVAATASSTARTETQALDGSGWLRVLVRVAFYAALMLFAGASLMRAALDQRGAGSWLAPPQLGDQRAAVARREGALVREAGILAIAAAAVVTLVDAAQAAGSISASRLSAYLIDNPAGRARLALVVLLGLSRLALAHRRAAAVVVLAALGALALSGHARAASTPGLAVAVDWLHLAAGSAWLGGIGVLVWSWWPWLRADDPARSVALRHVLPRFGRVALPAFVVTVTGGVANAALDLAAPADLWTTGYGRILAIKIGVVGLVALVSFQHAIRLRPQILAARTTSPPVRRDWRLLRLEPVAGVLILVAAAVLVASPLPPGQAPGVALASLSAASCAPCPLPQPGADQLSVAAQGGSRLVAAWIRRSGRGATAELRVIDANGRPSPGGLRVLTGRVTGGCGPACSRVAIPGSSPTLRLVVRDRARSYPVVLPIEWRFGKSRRARVLLEQAQRTMRGLRTVREVEDVSSIPEVHAVTRYRLRAPNRLAYDNYVVRQGHRPTFEGRSIVIGATEWDRRPDSDWWRSSYGAGLPFRTHSWFDWTTYAIGVQLLRQRGHVAEIALAAPATPAWWRVWIDIRSMRVIRTSLAARGHFMTQRFFAANHPLKITTPTP